MEGTSGSLSQEKVGSDAAHETVISELMKTKALVDAALGQQGIEGLESSPPIISDFSVSTPKFENDFHPSGSFDDVKLQDGGSPTIQRAFSDLDDLRSCNYAESCHSPASPSSHFWCSPGDVHDGRESSGSPAKRRLASLQSLPAGGSKVGSEAVISSAAERERCAEAALAEISISLASQEAERRSAIDEATFTESIQSQYDRLVKAKEVELDLKLKELQRSYEERMAAKEAELALREAEVTADVQRFVEQKDEEYQTIMASKAQELAAKEAALEAEKAREVEQKDAELKRRIAESDAELAARRAELEVECKKQLLEAFETKSKADMDLVRKLGAATIELSAHREEAAKVQNIFNNLPPLQTAMELGDMRSLTQEVRKWDESAGMRGEGGAVVQAVVNLARERLQTWQSVEVTVKEVLREVEHLPSSTIELSQRCHKLFRALKDAQLTKMDLCKSCPQATERMYEVLVTWQQRTMSHSNAVQQLIIRRVVTWPHLGPFEFPDLEVSLRLVDRSDHAGEVFLSRAKALVELETTHPKEFRNLLQHLETMLFFLKHTKSECLLLTHSEFKKQTHPLHPVAMDCLNWAAQRYMPGSELVHVSKHENLQNVEAVLEEIRKPSKSARGDCLAVFRDIFYHWALAMQRKFDVLALPHHTQMMCLLAFQHFLQMESSARSPRALLAQVGTGEGKSMVVAALAIYVVVALGKKAHIVIDDETLLERDFCDFKALFDILEVGTSKRRMKAVLCVSEDRLAASGGKQAHLAARVDPEADICYCEAKHVQSFYASIARGKRDFEGYGDRVLIVDEVDALVIDQEPNEAFVYPNRELSKMATKVAVAMAKRDSDGIQALQSGPHPAAKRVVSEMTSEWARGKSFQAHRDFVYSKESHRYCALQSGRANPNAWSLALECRNFQDGLVKDIKFQERLFVMSRPRVFQKYHRIIGVTGSIGSGPERDFIQQTYRAAFFDVPPFLRTCRGCPFHDPAPVRLGSLSQPVYVEQTQQQQLMRIAEVALTARERVPVLVIARDRTHVEEVLTHLRASARSRGLGSAAEDIVRSLSRTLCESDPMQWKDNLNAATLPLGDREGHAKTWRVTVTDPRGGRGTDYRVDDPDVDKQGGLLLIPALVPSSLREWTQFLGRTARQDRKGQFCAILSSSDYTSLASKYGVAAPKTGGVDVIKSILQWNDWELKERIRGSAALYNVGLRMNELCEDIFSNRSEFLEDATARERLVDVCQRMRWLSLGEIQDAFSQFPGYDPSRVPTQARDLGAPERRSVRRPGSSSVAAPQQVPGTPGASASGKARSVIFCLDRSCSMMSKDTGTVLSRFATCVACVQSILKNQVRSKDAAGIVGFGRSVEIFSPLAPKATSHTSSDMVLASMVPESAGGTCFFDAVATCLHLLASPAPGGIIGGSSRWLVCLTDGDDLGSRTDNSRGQIVSRMLAEQKVPDLNMIMITVGRLKAQNVQLINSWVEQVEASGGVGKHLPEQAAAAIASAFELVAECLDAEVGGATEC